MTSATPSLFDMRCSGVLLHPTSLPGPHGCGDFGAEAYHFVDWLRTAGQTLWQVLPLNPVGAGNSPYQSVSVFAGNPLLVDLAPLVERGWLDHPPPHDFERMRVDYGARRAVRAWHCCARPGPVSWRPPATRTKKHSPSFESSRRTGWTTTLFSWRCTSGTAGRGHAGLPNSPVVTRWHSIACAPKRPVKSASGTSCNGSSCSSGRASAAMRANAACTSSATCRSSSRTTPPTSGPTRDCSSSTRTASPTVVAGVPPDYFSADRPALGQPALRLGRACRPTATRGGSRRLAHAVALFDVVRLDHFRGFEAYWEVPGQRDRPRSTATGCTGPGADALRRAARRRSGRSAARSPRTWA